MNRAFLQYKAHFFHITRMENFLKNVLLQISLIFFSFFLLFRKGALLMNNIIAILASILMGISFPTGLFELLIAGRFLIGINSGE